MWKEFKFSDFVVINPTVSLKGTERYSFVEMKDLQDGNKFCLPSQERTPSSGSRFQENDTLFARITPCLENGRICKVKGLKGGIGFGSTEFLVFRGKKDVSDNDFVFYLSRWDEVRSFAENNFEGTSGRQRVPKTCFDNLVLQLPPLDEQLEIADTLSSLDNKIDLLHRQNETLEALAETLFRQWFIVEADESWETLRVTDVATINRAAISRSFPFDEIEYLDTGSITKGVIEGYQNYAVAEAPSRAQRIVRENDIVYSLVRPIQRHYGLLQGIKNNTIVSTGFAVITATGISPYFLYLLLTSNEVVDYFDMVAEGSTSAYPSLKPSDIGSFEFQKPSDEKLKAFHSYASNAWNKIYANRKQINTLTQLRDTLLPKLMSGEVKIENLLVGT